MTIKTRYSLITAALIGSVVVAITLTVTRVQRAILEAESQARLDDLGTGVVRLAEESLTQSDRLMLVSYLMLLKTEHPALAVASITTRKDGHTSTIGADRPGLIYWRRSIGQSLLVSVGFDKAKLDAQIDRALRPLFRRTVAIAGVFMMLGVGAAFSAAKLLTAPVTALSFAVGQIKEGNLDVTVDVARDDEIGALARRFNEMTGRLKDLVQFRDDIMHTLTHELNTPLGGLKAYLELWSERGLPAGPQRDDVLQTMMTAVARMENSLGSALRLFKAASGLSEGARKLVWVDELVREICTLFALSATSKNVAIHGLAPEVAECVYADEELMRQVVTNLISNALKYTPAGGEIRVGLESDARELRFWVADTGYGIKADDLPRLFTKFYRSGTGSDAGEPIPGTGLGLSIVHKAVQAMDGTIKVQSELGKGSNFLVSIPKPKAELEDGAAAVPSKGAAA